MTYSEAEITDIAGKIENFLTAIPEVNRDLAIQRATEKRINLLLEVWNKERARLPERLIVDNRPEADISGWEKYLRLCYRKDKSSRKKAGFEEWTAKFQMQMFRNWLDTQNKIDLGIDASSIESFYQRYFNRYSITGPLLFYENIWKEGKLIPIDPESLLVHSLDGKTLTRAIDKGMVGVKGIAPVAFCQDRIVFDRGWVVIFQAKDLAAAGYPLLKVNEEEYDADLLKEWRSTPVDINLARLIISTSEISDRDQASKSNVFGTSYFGEEYLRRLPRL